MDNCLAKFTKCDIFTPDKISKLMSSKIHPSGTLLEPSAGTGNLLKYIDINSYDVDVYEIKQEHLEKIQHSSINKHNEDFIKANINKKYDNIIMNPPYIKIQNLTEEYKKYLKDKFDVLKINLADVYYAFIIKCLGLLNDDGIMISITPNSYLYNEPAINLRKYLFGNTLIKEIIDFKDNKVFDNVSVYCCITIFTKTDKEYLIYNGEKIQYSNITNYSLFNFDIIDTALKTM
jgi:tRNA1(Val) A37 N6-methylase TrmN6